MAQSFDLVAALPAYTASEHTRRAYLRWIDRYLVDQAEFPPLAGEARRSRLMKLAVPMLRRVVLPETIRAWLDGLMQQGSSRQSLDQARAALVALAELLARAGYMKAARYEEIRAIPVPAVAHVAGGGRLLQGEEMKRLINAARDMAALPPAMARNQVVVLLLCTLVLRREEVSALQWGDVTLVKNRPTLRVDGALLEIPRPLLAALDRWRGLVTAGDGPPPAGSPLVRRIWKGGRIARRGLSPDGIWLIIHDAARYAGLEQVSPEDLRRSVVLSLRDAGTPIEALHSLLRHRTLIVTRRFLAKLPPAPAAEPPDEPL